MKLFQLPVLRCFLACCALYCAGCAKNLNEGHASFNYATTDIPKGEAFQHALAAFLRVNQFMPVAQPGTFLSDAGGHSSGAVDIWVKGSYKGSEPFYLRYFVDQTPKTSISMHSFVLFGVHGSDSDMRKLADTVNEFTRRLQVLADEYENALRHRQNSERSDGNN